MAARVESPKSSNSNVFWHAGLPKTGSTFLQREVFPRLRDIEYVRRGVFPKAPEWIGEKKRRGDVIYSREFETGVVWEGKRLATHHPEIRPIVVLRRHDEHIASLYRYRLKHGKSYSFRDYFDIERDRGSVKQRDMLFHEKLKILEHLFDHPPFVLFYHELKDNPEQFIERLAFFLGKEIDRTRVSSTTVNRSPSAKQLKYARRLGKWVLPQDRPQNAPLTRLYSRVGYHLILAAARLLPEEPVRHEALIDRSQLERIRAAYADDWEACLKYAHRTNPEPWQHPPVADPAGAASRNAPSSGPRGTSLHGCHGTAPV